MNQKTRFFFVPVAFIFSLGFSAFAGSSDQLLQDIRFAAEGQGVSNAIVMLDGHLAKGGLDQNDRARLVVLRIDFRTRDEREMKLDDDEHIIPDAIKLARKEIFEPAGVKPEVKLRALDILHERRRYRTTILTKIDGDLIQLAEKALEDPELKKNPDMEAAFHMRLGMLWAKRHCSDLALEHYRAAAACSKDPSKKADALFQGALAARAYRDMKTSSALLDEVSKLENASYEVQKRALLFRGENAIYADEHSWKPTPERVAEASKYVNEALSDHSPLVGKPEAIRARIAVIRATAKSGDLAGAVKAGREMFESKLKMEQQVRADLAIFIADTYHEMGDYKRAIAFYEKGLSGSSIGPKKVNMRIAKSARLGRNFFRAMQAYSEAIRYCDPEEGKDEIKYITGLIKQMNKSVRKGSSGFDSDAIFTDTNEDISGLSLDDE